MYAIVWPCIQTRVRVYMLWRDRVCYGVTVHAKMCSCMLKCVLVYMLWCSYVSYSMAVYGVYTMVWLFITLREYVCRDMSL